MCFDKKLPEDEIQDRFSSQFGIENALAKTQAGIGHCISTHPMTRI